MENEIREESSEIVINPFQTKEGIQLIKSMSFEIKFVSIINIISGVIACLTIFGAIMGIPIIISSLRAIDSANQFTRFSSNLSADSLYKAVLNLRTYFRIQFWVLVISLTLTLLFMILMFTLMGTVMNQIQDLPMFS